MPFKEFFEFQTGIPRQEEFFRLMDALALELEWTKPIAILMHPFDDFDPDLIRTTQPLGTQRTSHGEGVVTYQNGMALRKSGWELFRMAEPMYLFNFTGGIQAFMGELDAVFPKGKDEPKEFDQSRFVKRFGPIADLLPNPGRIYFAETGQPNA